MRIVKSAQMTEYCFCRHPLSFLFSQELLSTSQSASNNVVIFPVNFQLLFSCSMTTLSLATMCVCFSLLGAFFYSLRLIDAYRARRRKKNLLWQLFVWREMALKAWMCQCVKQLKYRHGRTCSTSLPIILLLFFPRFSFKRFPRQVKHTQ